MKKKYWIWLLVLMLLLTACSKSSLFPAEETTAQDSSEEETSESSEESSPEESLPPESEESEPEEPEEPEETPAIQELFCLKDAGFIRNLASYGDGSLFVCAGVLSDGDMNEKGTMYRIDPAEDKVITTAPMSGYDQEILALRKNGEVIVNDYENGGLLQYDQNLQPMEGDRIVDEYQNFNYMPDQDSLFYLSHAQLKKLSMDGEVSVLMENTLGLDISASNPAEGWLVLKESSDTSENSYISYLYDVADNRFLWSHEGRYGQYSFSRDTVLNLQELMSEERFEKQLLVLDPETGERVAHWEMEPYDTIFAAPETPWILSVSYGVDRGYQVRVVDPVSGQWAAVDLPEEAEYLQACWDETAACWFLSQQKEEETVLLQIDPARLSLTEKLEEKAEETEEPKETFPLGEHLTNARAAADELEQKYGVRILLGNEVYNYQIDCGFTLISSEDPEYGGGTEEEAAAIEENLRYLDDALSAYPEGFMETFVNGTGHGGLRFAFVRDLRNEEGFFVPGGVHSKNGNWFDITMDMDRWSVASIHHEMWHAVESRIGESEPGVFLNELWAGFNPDGFAYRESYEAYSEEPVPEEMLAYLLVNADDPYFVDVYSLTTAMEDRATLIESLYTLDFSPDGTEQGKYDYIMSFPHLKAKLDYMAEWTEKVFGSVYWAR